MRTDLFDYALPRELIAAEPAARREDSRLLVLDRATGAVSHRVFADIATLLRPGDLLVVNDSRVFAARIHGKRTATGGAVEMLLLERLAAPSATDGAARDRWRVLCRPAKKLKPGEEVYFANRRLTARVLHYAGEGERDVEFDTPDVMPWLDELGEVPLPPYIVQRRRELGTARPGARADHAGDRERYQTVYARDHGSVAAPTAGLHFSDALLRDLEARGVLRASVTLHVGIGTFKPVECENIEEHPMHEERLEISPETADAVNRARADGRRVVAVGTTAVRSMESAADEDGRVTPGRRSTRLMITPGYRFRAVDAMITNFHLPRSTLLMLVSAFAGRGHVLAAYEEAVRERYRFFSYGDAMFLA